MAGKRRGNISIGIILYLVVLSMFIQKKYFCFVFCFKSELLGAHPCWLALYQWTEKGWLITYWIFLHLLASFMMSLTWTTGHTQGWVIFKCWISTSCMRNSVKQTNNNKQNTLLYALLLNPLLSIQPVLLFQFGSLLTLWTTHGLIKLTFCEIVEVIDNANSNNKDYIALVHILRSSKCLTI